MNASMLEATGYTMAEIQGTDYFDLFVPWRDRHRRRALCRRVAGHEHTETIYGPILTKDGNELLVEWRARAVRHAGGKPGFIFGLGIDVTENVRTRRELEKQRDEAQMYLDLAGVMFLTLDVTGRVTSINRTGCEILGVRQEDVIGKDWVTNFIPDRFQDEIRDHLNDLVSARPGMAMTRKNPIRTAAGEERLIEWHHALLKDEAGNVTGTLSSGIDITERERAERTQRLIHEIGNAVHASRNTKELFAIIRESLGQVLNTENFFIALYDHETDTITLDYFVDQKDQGQFDSFPAGKTLTGYVVRNNTSLLLTREEADRWVEAGIVEIVGTPSQVWLGVPLRVRSEVIGALVVQSYTNPREFGPADRDMLEFVSGQIGFAIERKRADEELRASEARNRAIVEAVPDLMFQLDRSGRFLSYESPRTDDLAVSPEAFLGKSVDQVFPPHFAKEIRERVERALATDEIQLLEYSLPIPMPDGEVREFEARIVPSGEDTVLGVVRDITKRKRAEKLLRTLNRAALAMERTLTPDEVIEVVSQHLRTVGLYSVIWFIDESGERLGLKHTSVDREFVDRMAEIAGTAPEEFSLAISDSDIYRRTLRDKETVFVPDPEELLRQIVPSASQKVAEYARGALGASKSLLAPLVAEDRVFGVLSVHSSELTEDDAQAVTAFANQLAAALRKSTLLMELAQSLDELKSTQTQLLQAQKMEAIGRLAGGVAHDFNNLLTAISGYAELLLSRGRLDESVRSDVEQIRKAAEQAAALTRQLLAFSRRQPLQSQVIDLNRVVAEMDALLRRLIGEDIDLVTILDDEEVFLKADAGQIEQVIINLVVNARDAMPEGGRLIVKTKNVVLDEDACASIPDARPGRFARLSIEDSGAGMPKEIVDQIFEPFFSTKEPGRGTGLGLAVVYGIVRQHGGWINVYSEPGHGTVFKIYLPAVEREATEAEEECEARGKESAGVGQRILLVEDEEAVRDFAKRALSENGYVVVCASDADEAIGIFERERGDFELVFSDVVLPDKTGIQLADELLSRKPDLRVLLSSGYTDHKSQWPIVEERGYRFIQKPYSLPDLLGTVREMVGPR